MDKKGTKIFILIVIALAVCTSAIAGIFFYNITDSIRSDRKSFDSLDWVVQLDQYDRIEALDTDQELYIAYTADAGCLIDGSGKKVARSADDIKNSDILTVFTKGEKQGYKYLDGKVAIDAEFDEAYDFDGGYAKVSKNGTDYFVIDTNGRKVFDPGENASNLEKISGKYYFFDKGFEHQVVNVETGQITENAEDVDFYEPPYAIGEGMFTAKANFSWGDVEPMLLLSRSFKPISSGQLYGQIGCFGQGLCYVQKLVGATAEEHEDYQVENGYMNTDGEVVLTTDKALLGCKFAEGRALVYERERLYCIDKSGRMLFSLNLAKAFDRDSHVDFKYNYAQCYFRKGKAIVYDGKFYGLVDKEGNWLIQPAFDEMTYAGTDKLLVEYKGMSGMLRVK